MLGKTLGEGLVAVVVEELVLTELPADPLAGFTLKMKAGD
jgi:hypothetical protein